MKKEIKELFSLPEELIIERTIFGKKEVEIYCRIKKRKMFCPHCSGKVSGYDSVKNRKRHTVVDGKTIYLNLLKRRFECKECHKVCTEKVLGMEKSYSTDHFVKLVQEKARNRDYSSVAREMNITGMSVSRMVDRLKTNRVCLPKKRTCASDWTENI